MRCTRNSRISRSEISYVRSGKLILSPSKTYSVVLKSSSFGALDGLCAAGCPASVGLKGTSIFYRASSCLRRCPIASSYMILWPSRSQFYKLAAARSSLFRMPFLSMSSFSSSDAKSCLMSWSLSFIACYVPEKGVSC